MPVTLIRTVTLFAILSAFVTPAVNAQNYDNVTIRTERLAEGVYVLYGAGGNIGVAIGPDAVFVVDDQFAPLTPKIQAAIAALTDKPVRFVLNTHWHYDHTGGNENMGKAGAILVAHDNVRRRMSTRQFIAFAKREVLPSPEGALPVVTFNDGVTFHINGDEIAVIHLPTAHTDGDAAVHFRRANVVHMGDVFFRGFPYADISSGGSISGILAGVDRILTLINDSTKVIPGHGAATDKATLRAYRDMIATVHDRIRKQVRAKATLEQVIASKPTAEFDAAFGSGFIKPADFISFVYDDAKRAATAPRK